MLLYKYNLYFLITRISAVLAFSRANLMPMHDLDQRWTLAKAEKGIGMSLASPFFAEVLRIEHLLPDFRSISHHNVFLPTALMQTSSPVLMVALFLVECSLWCRPCK